VTGRQKGAPSLRYHTGKPSRPVAAGHRLSRMLNICLSLIYSRPDSSTVCFSDGARPFSSIPNPGIGGVDRSIPGFRDYKNTLKLKIVFFHCCVIK